MSDEQVPEARAARSSFGLRRRWSDLRLRGKGSVLVAIPLLVLAVAAGLFAYTLKSDSDAQYWVSQSEQIQSQIAVVDSLVVSRESDERGYLAFGSTADLATAESDDTQLQSALARLATLVRSDPAQARRLSDARGALAGVPPLPQSGTASSAEQGAQWMRSERVATANARAVLREMRDAGSQLLQHRRDVADRWRLLAGWGVGGLLLIGLMGGIFGVRLFTRSIAHRVDRLEADLDAVDLDRAEPPDDSADELGRLSRRLRATVQALGRRESELREARAFLERIMTVGPVVVLRAVDGVVTYVSPNCARVLGIGEIEALSSHFWLDTMAPEDLGRYMSATRQLGGPDAPEVVEFEGAFDIAGRRRYLSCLMTRESAPAGEQAFLAYLLDITDRHNAEREGAQRQRELSAITAASPDVIAVFTADLRVAFVSEATTSITGFRVSDRIGAEAGATVHEDDRQPMIDAVRSVISGAAEDFSIRVRTRHVSGRYLLLEGHGRPLLGSDGEPVAAVAIFRDISDRIALEAALVEARDAADAASRAKSEFLSRMSHELRTPLNVVLGFTQLLQMESLGEEQRSWVDQVLKAGRHLLDLINEVLDIARIESGALALSPESVSLRDVVGETVEAMRPIAAANDVTIDFLIEGDDLYVQSDRQRLRQVLLNLLANSVKYNRPHGSVLITSKAGDADMVAIRVSDTGIGIAAEHIERLFVPFDRLGAEHSTIEGTGVGLPLSLRLVEAMAGDLSVESTPGEGSTFIVTLPCAAAPVDADADGMIAAAEMQMNLDDVLSTHGTLLYIEDNLTNLQLMQRIVGRRSGIRLLHAFQGRMGLDLARTGHADLIMLDLHLPDMTGIEVLGQLRADPVTAGVPVYIVSADATAGQVARMRAAGAAGYLTKPLDVRRVLALLDSVLEGAVAATEGE
jgi:PAS domain S-box-containing protein